MPARRRRGALTRWTYASHRPSGENSGLISLAAEWITGRALRSPVDNTQISNWKNLDKGERRSVGRPRGWRLTARTGSEAFHGATPVGGPAKQVVLSASGARAEDDPFAIWRKDAVIALSIYGNWSERAACDVIAPYLTDIPVETTTRWPSGFAIWGVLKCTDNPSAIGAC